MTVELDEKHWEPVPGATATAEEFIAARAFIHQIHWQCRWSPWVLQDRAGEYDAALATCGQWARTDQARSGKTVEEYEAELEQQLAEADAQFDAEEAQAGKVRVERARHYAPERDRARLAMLELQGMLADKIRERDEMVSGGRFVADDEDRIVGLWPPGA